MPKVALKSHKQAVYIQSSKETDMYWQCGQWVKGMKNATRYYDAQEADMVVALRSLHDVEIIEAIS